MKPAPPVTRIVLIYKLRVERGGTMCRWGSLPDAGTFAQVLAEAIAPVGQDGSAVAFGSEHGVGRPPGGPPEELRRSGHDAAVRVFEVEDLLRVVEPRALAPGGDVVDPVLVGFDQLRERRR